MYYVIYLDEYESIRTHWIVLYMNGDNVTYFDSFGFEYILNEIKIDRNKKNIIANIYRIQVYNSIICGTFCIVFINFLLKGRNLLDYTNLFSAN